MQEYTSPEAPIPSSSKKPLSGHWKPHLHLENLFYGEGCVTQHLLSILPSPSSKVFVVTGHSLATKTPLVKDLENLLGERHAATYSSIRQHGPSTDIDAALATILQHDDDDTIDTILSLGGGSPIDSAKIIAYRLSGKKGKWLTHITIPTTLSAAECTPGGGYTRPDGLKIGFLAPEMAVKSILYDPYYASFTPKELWLGTGIRALDHAVECCYHPCASEIWKAQAAWAVKALFEYLPKARESHPWDSDVITQLQLAAFLSSGLKGGDIRGGMGLSHSLGHALGSPYGIPHGVTSCLTLGRVVKMKAQASREDAEQIARLLPATGTATVEAKERSSGDNVARDACKVGDRILKLVDDLGISVGTLSDRRVSRSEIPIIVGRACGSDTEGQTKERVQRLVESLF
ncbi:MAG: hypothetical protein Q9219_007246 [cf. Caloplaca sp. 3 TL-2023]